MKKIILKNQPIFRARIIGIILIIIGAVFLINPTSLNIKISFVSIFIGIFTIVMINEKSISKKISDAQAQGNVYTIKTILKDIGLEGNAIFLPKTNHLTEERILIPPSNKGVVKIPKQIQDNTFFLIGEDGKNFGISIPPSGLKLLNEIDKNGDLKNTEIENINEKLQIFVGMNLLKSVSVDKQKNGWSLEVNKPIFGNNGYNIDRQYPSPICSAIIIALTRLFNNKIRIYDVTQKGDKITFTLNFIKQRTKQEV